MWRPGAEASYRELAAAMPQLVCIMGADGAIEYANQNWRDYTGIGGEPVASTRWLSVLHPEDRDAAAARWRQGVRSSVPSTVEYRMRRASDGAFRWFVAHGAPWRDHDGRVTGWLEVCTDVHDQRRAHTEVAECRAQDALEYQEQARMALDAAELGSWRHDVRTGQVSFDERGAEHYGLCSRNVTMDEVLARVHPDDVARMSASIDRATDPRSHAHYGIEYRVIHRDGSVHWLSAQDGVRFEGQGASRRAVLRIGTSRDVTESHAAAEALRAANRSLREADERKNAFLAMLSHELRNPLASIRNSVYIVDHVVPGCEQSRRACQVIDRQAQHLTRLVDDLLEITRMTRGMIRLHREHIDLRAVVLEAAEDHRGLFAKNGVNFDVEVAPEPVGVFGDRTRLAQAIGNLLSNAAKFTPRGGRAKISLDAGDDVVVRVSDTGVGIAPDILPHVFEPFVQADSSLDRSRGGLGLGLALTRSLAELHGGSVTASSAGLGRGAEFVLRLPLHDQERWSAVRRPEPRSPGLRRRVLIIENNSDSAESLKEVIELAGHEAEVARNAGEGLEMARRSVPDVVLCDIGLPGMDGYEVARALRKDPAFASSLLVALTGYASLEDRQRALESGFDRHVPKPPDMGAIEQVLAWRPG